MADMFGVHCSIAGGLHNALLEAERLHTVVAQIFTKNQKQWKCAPLEHDEIHEWDAHCKRLQFKQTVSHASYLINPASPDEMLWRKSVNLFIEEVTRCAQLGIPNLVIHPGAHMGQGEESGIMRIVAALDVVLAETAPVPRAKSVTVCLESTAGQGSSVGHRLEHLAEIIERVKSPNRFGVCLDTAHLFAAGYDFRGRKFAKFRTDLDKILGISRVKVLHLNDSKKELGSRVDRHEHIGRGLIGVEGFKPWMREEAFDEVPKIIETEKGVDESGRDWDEINLEVLRGLC